MSGDRSLRRRLLATAMAMNEQRINHGGSGNVSVRQADGFLITPSAIPYEDCRPEDTVRMDMTGEHEGMRRPSSEWRFHRDIYQHRPEAGAVLHAHAPCCTTLACLGLDIPSFHYMVAKAGGSDIRCAPYALFGSSELAHLALAALDGRKACLLANHGMLCFERNLGATLELAVEVENLARVYVQTLQIGKPELLDDTAMAAVTERFKDYRQS